MTIVCLDTQLVQWALMKRASDNQSRELVRKASQFMAWLEKQDADVIIPSIVVGELLVPIPQSGHVEILTKITGKWMVVDYDLQAAQQFAVMRYDRAIVDIMADIRQGNPYATRRQLIADVMIIATAIVNGAEKLYSHNKDFIRLATSYVDVQNFLDVPFMPDLPGDGI